jgi:hypothetical protein
VTNPTARAVSEARDQALNALQRDSRGYRA